MNQITKSCLKCKTFSSTNTTSYRCATQNCPGNQIGPSIKKSYLKGLDNTGRRLILALRHNPQSIGIELDSGGWTDITGVLDVLKLYLFELEHIVETSNKKRFELNNEKTKIRACQGHSLNIDLGLETAIPPIWLYHGTAEKNIKNIKTFGLSKMNRQHVHLSTSVSTAYHVGKRHGKPIIISICAKCMVDDGYKFYLSKNGVWLTDYVSPKYFHKIGVEFE